MPLSDMGQRVETLTGINAKAQDGAGNNVIVSATHEAIHAHGWPTIWDVAGRKYDAGTLETPGPPPMVRVTEGDC
jgi:hypothetical protein